ncbi:MAG: hypothetical protein ACRDIV_03150 [Ktedonobacteraceae bacterium]
MLDDREKKKNIMELLLISLEKTDDGMASNIQDILHGTGAETTDYVAAHWHSRNPTELARARMIDVEARKHDGEAHEKKKALDFLLGRLNDESPIVQQHLSSALCGFAPDSIQPLIDLVLASNEITHIVQHAVTILIKIGEPCVIPVCEALNDSQERMTDGLLRVLFQLKDPRAIPYLINYLNRSVPKHVYYACLAMRVLGSFRIEKVIPPLINILRFPDEKLYDTAMRELSNLGAIALDDLLQALDVEQDDIITQRIYQVFINMQPFPQARLLDAFQHSDKVAKHIKETFKQHAAATASFMVNNLFHPHPKVRHYTRLTVEEMNRDVTVPYLIEALINPSWQPVIKKFLISYTPSIPLLIQKLSSTNIGDEVFNTLLAFDSRQVIPSLVIGLQESQTRQETKRLIVELAGREPALLPDIVRLFDPSVSNLHTLPPAALAALQEILTQELANESLPELINGLDGKLLEHCSDTLVILSRKDDMTETVVQALINALSRGGLLFGAKQTLVNIGKRALMPVNLLLDSDEDLLVEAAQDILSKMGADAFSIIYDRFHNPRTTASATKIYSKMPTATAAVGLAAYLSSSDLRMTEIAVYLLFTRINEEDQQRKVELIPALLEQTRKKNISVRRIIAPLLLFNGNSNGRRKLAEHIVNHVLKHPERHLEFMRILPFIGERAIKPLEDILNDNYSLSPLLPEAVAILGLISRNEYVEKYVAELASLRPVVKGQHTRQLYNPLSFRALGGLLASGSYNPTELLNLKRQAESQRDDTAFEFYDVLLGMRNMPAMAQLNIKLTEASNDLYQSNQQISRLKGELEDERARSTRLSNEQKQSQRAINNAQSTIDNLNNQITSLNYQNSQLLEEKRRLRNHQ